MKPTSRIRRPPPSPTRSLSRLLHKGRMGRIRQPGNVPLFEPVSDPYNLDLITKAVSLPNDKPQ